MAAPASNKSGIGPTEFLLICALLGGTLRYRTLLWQLAWEELTTRVPAVVVIGQYPRTSAILAGGVLVVILLLLAHFVSFLGKRRWNETKPLTMVSADQLRRMKGQAEPQPVDGFTARGRLTALTALPKQGKTFAWFGLLKARQSGGTWFGRRVLPGKTCVMTEEDRGTFAAKVHRFGITGTSLISIHAPETGDGRFGREAWPALVHDAAKRARKQGCDTLCVDTLTTWAPWAFAGPEAMSVALRTLKQAAGQRQLACVVILHNRKQQSDLGAIVDMLGTIAGSAAYDVVAGFKREKDTGDCTLAVEGRLGEWECAARLVNSRYLPLADLAERTPADVGEEPPALPPPPAHMASVVDVLRRAGHGGLTRKAIQEQTGLAEATLHRYLLALVEGGHLTREGKGVSGDPHVWRAVDLPAPPPTADPEYVRYLGSPEWERKRRAVLERSDGQCEVCGLRIEASEMEVHHSPEAYALVPEEPISLLAGLCPGCHRRAHAS